MRLDGRDLTEWRGDHFREWKHEVLRSLELPTAPARGGPDPMESACGRRDFLRVTAQLFGAALVGSELLGGMSRLARADEPDDAVETGIFIFPRLKFSVKDETHDQWFCYPSADTILRKNLERLTNINVSREPVIVSLAEMDQMCRYPFVFMTSEGYFDIPQNEEDNLKEFLRRGGFFHADDCVWRPGQEKSLPSDMPDGVFRVRSKTSAMDGDRFFYDFLKLMHNLFPENALHRIPYDHAIYHCYFNFPNGCPHLQGVNHGGWGIFEKGTGRIMSFASPGDLHCGWTNMFWNEKINMNAIKMGINVIIYFLTH